MSLCNENICIYQIYFIALTVIILYGFVIKQYIKKDIFEQKFAPYEGCDIWGLFHVTLYAILGYNFPSHYILFTSIGIGYELFEYLIGTTTNDFKKLGPISSDGTQSWWYGRISDLVFNTIGLLIGIYLSRYRKCDGVFCNDT